MSSGPRKHDNAGEGEMASKMELIPIVLVHGFLGFDADTLIKFPYWGGSVDLEAELQGAGLPVFSAMVGPVSSNWDRACELYAFIKGGRVDYGAAHAAQYGHARFGREYPGVFPRWGTVNPQTGDVYKVHFIGHSMGGQTVRVLAHLLEYGDMAEAEFPQDDRSELFGGGHSWIHSVTSISTPHDGTTLIYEYDEIGRMQKFLLQAVATVSLRRKEPTLDLMLEHWGAAVQSDESFEDFIQRAIKEDLWRNTDDFCYHDLNPAGAAELNGSVITCSDVYYFSWATSRTNPKEPDGVHVPMTGMNLPLHGNAKFIGSLVELPPICGDDPSLWWENDGIVNTCSMDGPSLGSVDTIVNLPQGEDPDRGVWNYMGTLKPYDHWQIHIVPPVGNHAPPGYESLVDFYVQWCRYLEGLPR